MDCGPCNESRDGEKERGMVYGERERGVVFFIALSVESGAAAVQRNEKAEETERRVGDLGYGRVVIFVSYYT